jgi:copper chaperone
METSFTVPSITCSICSGRIKDELSGLQGIDRIDIDLKSQSVSISYDPELQQPDTIRKKIAELGYEVYQ